MRDRADAADARHEAGHLVERAALREFLEAAHLGYVEVCVFNFARGVELDRDFAVALEAGDGVDGDGLAHDQAPNLVRAGTSSGASVTSAVSAL